MTKGGALNKAFMLIIGLLAVVVTAAAACGSDADPTAGRRPEGTTSPVITTEPVATNTPAATNPPPTAPPASVAEGDPNAGNTVFLAKGCQVCHAIQGVSDGAIGPALDQVGANAASRIADTSAEAYIRQAIEDPPSFLVEGYVDLMPLSIRDTMSDQEFEDLVAYLLSQK